MTTLDELTGIEAAQSYYLNEICGYTEEDTLDSYEEVCLYQGPLEEAATDVFNECYLSDVPEHMQNYIDYKKFACDCELSGSMHEFEFEGVTYTVTNASEFYF